MTSQVSELLTRLECTELAYNTLREFYMGLQRRMEMLTGRVCEMDRTLDETVADVEGIADSLDRPVAILESADEYQDSPW